MRRKERPFGIWILTAFDAIAIGVIPLVLLLEIFQDPGEGISVVTFTVIVALRLIIIAAAYGTWTGDGLSRLILLHTTTVACLLMVFGNAEWLGELIGTGDTAIFDSIGNIYRGIFWLCVNWWYLNRKETKSYFELTPSDA